MTDINYSELGTAGLNDYSGFIAAAYATELQWPGCSPLLNRLRRSDPEMTTVRQVFTALARAVRIDWQLPDNPTDGDKAAQEFAQQVIDDLDGGASSFLETIVNQIPFMGFGWFDVVPGVRRSNWVPPDPDDDWRSEYDDGRIGFRRFAWRDTSSFDGWDLTPHGRVRGMYQNDFPNPRVYLPLAHGLHLRFGDTNNPEGLTPLEAVWRLERLAYGYQVVHGIGSEKCAGLVKFTAESNLTPADRVLIDGQARAILSAKEGNYLALPKHITAEILDINFQAAMSILEMIRYLGLLKLQVYLSQWVSIASTAGTGAYSAMSDASSMAIIVFNSMLAGFASQIDAQVGKRLFTWNAFPGMTTRPHLYFTPIEKQISLQELGSILAPLQAVMPLGADDQIAIRRKTGFLPESLPEKEATPPTPPPPQEGQPQDQAAAMAERQRYWANFLLHNPQVMNHE